MTQESGIGKGSDALLELPSTPKASDTGNQETETRATRGRPPRIGPRTLLRDRVKKQESKGQKRAPASEEQVMSMHQTLSMGFLMIAGTFPEEKRPTIQEIDAFLAPLERIYLRHSDSLTPNPDLTDAGFALFVVVKYMMRTGVFAVGRKKPQGIRPTDPSKVRPVYNGPVVAPREVLERDETHIHIPTAPAQGDIKTGSTGMPITPPGPLDESLAALFSAIQTSPQARQAYEASRQGT